MMYVLEIISLCLALIMCIICTKSDIREGLVRNKVLIVFSGMAIVIDLVYYGFFAKDLLFDFLPNFIIVTLVSLALFYTHSFAGGDCKLSIVLALLYPARYYIVFKNSIYTLVFAIGLSILVGYIYLLATSVKAIVTKKVEITFNYVKNFFLIFLKSYVYAMAYIVLLNCFFILLENIGVIIDTWICRCLCIVLAWCVARYPIFKKIYFLIPTVIVIIIMSIINKVVPISLNPENYIFVLVLLLCQMTIKSTIYEKVKVQDLKKGMILTTFSSILMQNSITKGLPTISTEDLKSRLTMEEVESVKIWAKATHTEELTVVKKIPFAMFITIGFFIYFVIWCVLI